MTALIDKINNALAQASPANDLLHVLKDSAFIFKQNYPVTFIHRCAQYNRCKENPSSWVYLYHNKS